MREVILESLTCIKTQDADGVDECRLDVIVDGEPCGAPLRTRLGRGQVEGLANGYRYEDEVTITLWDEDLIGADEHLGTVEIGAVRQGRRTHPFRGEDARYELRYRVAKVERVPGPGDVDEALDLFARSTQAGIWPNIDKTALLDDMGKKLANPLALNQATLPLCGPATIAFELVTRNPVQYVQICKALYENGSFLARNKTIRCSRALIESPIRGGISIADWLFMASLRDAENLLFPMSTNLPNLALNIAGITAPWELRGWILEILNLQHTDFALTYLFGDVQAIQKAHAVKAAGGLAFLFIDTGLLGSGSPVGYPNHWIVYLDGLEIKDGHVKFDCYSWGGRHSVNKPEDVFEKCLWGVVTGNP